MLSRVNDLRGGEKDSLKGWFRAEVYSGYILIGACKIMPRQIWTMWYGKRFVCAPVLTATPVPSFPREGNQACGPEGSHNVLRMDHQGTRTPLCTPPTECPRVSHRYTVYGVKTTLWKCFTVKGSFGLRSNEDKCSPGW